MSDFLGRVMIESFQCLTEDHRNKRAVGCQLESVCPCISVTPTVNIVSEGMQGKVTKALTRENMLNHPTYKSWVTRSFHKAEYVQNLVKEHGHDSK